MSRDESEGVLAMADGAGKSWMWAEACALVDEAERMHRRFFRLLATSGGPAWEPPTNITSSGGDVFVTIALPGAEPGDVAVEIATGVLRVEARVRPMGLFPHAGIVRLEIPYGIMRRSIALPPGRYLLSERRAVNGCLYLKLREVAQ
jgi:HSP20 family molecular chaperone IbpA